MYFAWDFLVGKMGLGQAEQNRTLNCTYDQLFVLHCTADWGQHGLSIVNKSQKMLEDDGNGLAPSFLLVSINVASVKLKKKHTKQFHKFLCKLLAGKIDKPKHKNGSLYTDNL